MRHRQSVSRGLGILMACLVSGCGGTKILKEQDQQVVEFQAPLALEKQAGVHLALDWVVVRNSPGSWVSDADWDEYRLRLINQTEMPVKVAGARLFDSLGTPLEPLSTRKRLVKASKDTVRRHKDQGLEVRAGWSEGTLLVAGTASAVAGTGLGLAALTSGSAATAGVAIGALVLAPVMAVGGIMRGVNNGKVSREIEVRHTGLPVLVDPQQVYSLDFFFPLAPSPQRLEVALELADGAEQLIVIDTSGILNGLHLKSMAQPGAESHSSP